MGKFIVMDIVFYAGSLNYDQGSGNYQELKKITKWDGKQYTFVSRYALRYSILETGRNLGYWKLAEGRDLMPEENQKVIQPSEDLLLSGRILEYPEFDLFGYLLTSTQPQNFREAPVKLSHAISLTPYNYDALFNANIGLANRLRKYYGEMSPNPFTSEEHFTYYQYSILVDLDRVGKIEVYLSKKYKKGNKEKEMSKFSVGKSEKGLEFNIEYGNLKKISFTIPANNQIELEKVFVPLKKDNVSIHEELRSNFSIDENLGIAILKFKLTDITERIKQLIKTILNLHRSIKGRDEDLSPKLLILGLYENEPYKTLKDKIMLKDEYTEEEYDEITVEEAGDEIEKTNQGKNKVIKKVIHKVTKRKKPVFEILGLGDEKKPKNVNEGKIPNLNDEEILNLINKFLEEGKDNKGVYVYKSPEIEVIMRSKGSFESSTGA